MKKENTLPPVIFLGGAPALDFLNSVATPVDEIVEWIGNGVDFLSWMKQARLLTDDDVRKIQNKMSPAQLNTTAKDARALRDWFRGFIYEHKGNSLKNRAFDQLGPLNRLLGSDAIFWQIEPSGTFPEQGGHQSSRPVIFRLRPQRHWHEPESLLFALAEEIAKFICSIDLRRVKACEGGKCTLLFLDQSHRRGRRWCSMAICGNRAKSAAFAVRTKNANRRGKSWRKSNKD